MGNLGINLGYIIHLKIFKINVSNRYNRRSALLIVYSMEVNLSKLSAIFLEQRLEKLIFYSYSFLILLA